MGQISVLDMLQLIHMFKGCKQEDLPPHVYSAAQIAYRDLLASRRDQSILFLGRSGSGKTCSLQHCLHYLIGAAGSINNILTGLALLFLLALMCRG